MTEPERTVVEAVMAATGRSEEQVEAWLSENARLVRDVKRRNARMQRQAGRLRGEGCHNGRTESVGGA